MDTHQNASENRVQQQQRAQELPKLSLNLKNLVNMHVSSQPRLAFDTFGPLVSSVIDSDLIFHGSFMPYASLSYFAVEHRFRPSCVVDYNSYLTRKRGLFPHPSTDLSGFHFLQKSENVNDLDLPLEHLILDHANTIRILESPFNVESRATAAAYLPIFFEACKMAMKCSLLYRPSFNDAAVFQFPIQYLQQNDDGNWSCKSALYNDLRPDISLTFGRSISVVFAQYKMEVEQFDRNVQKAVGLAMAAFRDIVVMARVLFEAKFCEFDETSMPYLKRCKSGNFVLPFATCHNEEVTFYCLSAEMTAQTDSSSTLDQNPFTVWSIASFDILTCSELIHCAVFARNMVDYCIEVMGLHHWLYKYTKSLILFNSKIITLTKLKQSIHSSPQSSNLPPSVTEKSRKRQRTTRKEIHEALALLEAHLTDIKSEIRDNNLIVFGTVSTGTTLLSHAVGENVVVKVQIGDDFQIQNETLIRSVLPPNDFIPPLLVEPFELMPQCTCLVMKNVGSTSAPRKHFHELKSVAKQLLKNIQMLHHFGFAHLDLKPSNVVFNGESKNGVQVHLIDLGCAREIVAGKCHDAFNCGTEYYRAPEVSVESGVVGPASDFYSIGKTLEEYSENVTLKGEEKKWVMKLIQTLTLTNPTQRYVALSFVDTDPSFSDSAL